ncbi:hypothetical protein M422DRAFT_23184 [Sphaerobolus stellatus SS14]|nr:hypothetical protein M422DRAFT_23184 [Sphaerobolus stellatus SS14]
MYATHTSYAHAYPEGYSSSRRSSRPAESTRPRYADDRAFPGPLHIPTEPRLHPTPSPSSSSHSSDSFRSPSPPTWRDPNRHEKLPPIHHLTASLDWGHDRQRGGYPDVEPPVHYRSDPYGMPPSPPYSHSHPHSHSSAYPAPSRPSKKFGAREGSRYLCTYVSPVSGARCAIWDQGWTVYATLNRHAEAEHAPEEIALINAGRLGYDQAQIVTSQDKHSRLEEQLAVTGQCPDCGTVFSSGRKDSLIRHKQTNACEKAQKRGRPPTKFPKKPKGQGYHLESDEGY